MLADNLCNPGSTGPVYQETMHALSRTQTVCPSTKTSGEEKCGLHVSGIVIEIANCVMSWRPFSAGLCHLRLTAKPFPISLISTYNHTEDLDACVKETFDIHVNDLVDLIPKNFLQLTGDWNTKLGSPLPTEIATIGSFILVGRNDSGDRLAQVALARGFLVTKKTFKKTPVSWSPGCPTTTEQKFRLTTK